jgi:hypothetical protein
MSSSPDYAELTDTFRGQLWRIAEEVGDPEARGLEPSDLSGGIRTDSETNEWTVVPAAERFEDGGIFEDFKREDLRLTLTEAEAEGTVTELEREQALETLTDTPVRIAGEVDPEALAGFPTLDSNRTFTSRQNDRISVTVYDEDRTRPSDEYPTLEFQAGSGRLAEFVGAIRTLPADAIASNLGAIETDTDLVDEAAEREVRRETRQAGREAAEAAGVDLDEFGIGATAEGEVIVQDRDTGRTRTIDANAPGGVGSAIDAATGDGQFVADDADPAAGASGSGDGLGARAAGVVVLLFGAIAAALGWLS